MADEMTTVENNFPENVTVGFNSMASFTLLQRIANMFCSSSLVPDQFKGKENLGNCVIALNMASRMNADPLMVMQNLYVVYGNPAWSTKFLISTFNMCGRYSSIHYDETGQKETDSWGCVAWATEKGTGKRLDGPEVTIKIAKDEGWYDKKGSKWKSMPGQMLRYRAAAWFIRTTAPELSMGLQTADEIIDVTPENQSYDRVETPINEIHNNANKEILTPELPQPTPVVEMPKNVTETTENAINPAKSVNETPQTATRGPGF